MLATAEARKQHSDRLRAVHADPIVSARVRAANIKSLSRPEVREKIAAAGRARFAKPGEREKQRQRSMEVLQCPGMREKISAGVTARFAKPGEREKQRQSVRAAYTSTDLRRKVGASVKQALHRPEVRQRHLDALREAAKKRRGSKHRIDSRVRQSLSKTFPNWKRLPREAQDVLVDHRLQQNVLDCISTKNQIVYPGVDPVLVHTLVETTA